jgi:hypothetical protein
MRSTKDYTIFFDIELEKPASKVSQAKLMTWQYHLFSQMRFYSVEFDPNKTTKMDLELK